MERLTERLENGVINVKYASQHETAIHCLASIEYRLCWSRWNCCMIARGLLQGLRSKSWIGWKRDCGRDRA